MDENILNWLEKYPVQLNVFIEKHLVLTITLVSLIVFIKMNLQMFW